METAVRMNYDYLRSAELSDVGRQRPHNEDTTLRVAEHGVFGVFDGMGGAAGGAEASQISAEAVRRAFAENAPHTGVLATMKGKALIVRKALNEGSREIFERAQNRGVTGSGTTAVLIIFDSAQPRRATILHAGDSRAYRFRGERLMQLTRDHSFAVAAGVASEKSLPPLFRGVVTRAVGLDKEVMLEETLTDVAPDDIFILCSDGVTKMLSDLAINQTCRRLAREGVDALAAGLINESNDLGGFDNSSVVVIGIPSNLAASAVLEIRSSETISYPVNVTAAPTTEVITKELVKKADEREALLRRIAKMKFATQVALAVTTATAAAIGLILLYRLVFR